MFVYVLLTTSIGPLFSIGSEILTAVSPRQTMKFHNRNTCVRKKSFPHITRGDIQTSAIWYLVVLYCDQIELKGFGWQVELENEGVNDSHRDVLSVKNSLSRAVKSPLCWHEIQSKANHHSLTFKDYEQAGGKTCDNYIAIVNPDFPSLKNLEHCGFICLQGFEKINFTHLSREEDHRLPLHLPGVEPHSCSTTLGQGPGVGTGGALFPPHPPANTGKLPSYLLWHWTQSTAQPNHRSPYDAVSAGLKILCFTATNASVPTLVIGITGILQNRSREEIISEATVKFELCAVPKM